ncbi:MAG: undecaprenyldiphospho-muramoylpentapeptide beta-N-acetylglucosaminyltransferase [Bacillota bacterium]
MKLILAGGGTGGHIYPAIALADKWQKSAGEVIYIGGYGSQEERVAEDRGIPFYSLPVKPLPRRPGLILIKSLSLNTLAFFKAREIIKKEDPDIVVGTGGYSSGAVLLAAKISGYPAIIHEQNAIPGLTNKLLARFVNKVALTYPNSAQYISSSSKKTVITGNPIRPEILKMSRDKARKELNITKSARVVMVMGGSQGAQFINQLMAEIYSELIKYKEMVVIHVTGYKKENKPLEAKEKLNNPSNLVVKPYIENIELALAAADLVVSRAGATSLAEITGRGLPAILIPYPHAANNHQIANAEYLTEAGAASLLLEKDLNSDRLYNAITTLINDQEKLEAMRTASKRLARPKAADNLYNLAVELAR